VIHYPAPVAASLLAPGAVVLGEAVAIEISTSTVLAAAAALGIGALAWFAKRELANKDRAIERMRSSMADLFARHAALERRVDKIETERQLLGR